MTGYDRRGRPGRPRHSPNRNNVGLSPKEQVLDAAAYLFVDQGFAKTSTREIAERVGIRQASIYYHFPNGKDDILIEVVGASIRPTLDHVDVVQNLTEDPATALYLLILIDVRTLADAPHNSGLLGLLPDVRAKVPEFEVERKELRSAYQRLGDRVAQQRVRDEIGAQMGSLLIQNVENVIPWISNGSYSRYKSGDVIASACLRICGEHEVAIDQARAAAHILLAQFEEEQDSDR